MKVYSLNKKIDISNITIINKSQDILDHLNYLIKNSNIPIVVDVETIDLKTFGNTGDNVFVYTYKNHYTTFFIVLTYKDKDNKYIVLEIPFSNLFDFKEHNNNINKYKDLLFEVMFNSINRKIINHNIKFDIKTLLWDERCRYTIKDIVKKDIILLDTRVMSRMYIDDLISGYDLENLCKTLLDIPSWKYLLKDFFIELKKENETISNKMELYNDDLIENKTEFKKWFKENIIEYLKISNKLLEKIHKYIYFDGIYTYQLYEFLDKKLKTEAPYLYKLNELKAKEIRFLIEIETEGLTLNKEEYLKEYNVLKEKINNLEKEIKEILKDLYFNKLKLYTKTEREKIKLLLKKESLPEFTEKDFEDINVSSGQQMSILLIFLGGLYELFEFKAKKTKGYSTRTEDLKDILNRMENINVYETIKKYSKKGWLKKLKPLLKEQKILVKKYIEYKDILQHISLFYDKYFEGKNKIPPLVYKNKVYPEYNITGAKTGRLSCKNPNVQQLDKEGKIRTFFISSFGEKEGVIINIDYSQVEVRVNALLSQAKNMIESYKNGEDIYINFAKKLYNIDDEDLIRKKYRQSMKAVVLGMQFGETKWGLSKGLKIPVNEADNLLKGYFKVYPEIVKYHQFLLNQLFKKGYILGGTFRRKTLDILKMVKNPQQRWEIINQRNAELVNFPVQSSASDTCIYNFNKFYTYLVKEEIIPLDSFKMYMTVHDSVVISVKNKDKYIEKIIQTAKEVLENSLHPLMVIYLDKLYGKGKWENIPILVDAEVGYNYKKYSEENPLGLMDFEVFKEKFMYKST